MNDVYRCYIEALLATDGFINRGEMAQTFGVALLTITRHIGYYRQIYPGALEFDPSSKKYFPGRTFSTRNLDSRKITPHEFLNAVRTVFGK
ncbi:hypothetical protein [Aeromonas hydrophila]|uniref:hypothetical protein n=1 Tax=Aeromonas hydrophila TaxID=644 RepID=UPI00126A6D94|nr:hypothetical protein [Aeromonas hydrophila]